MIANQLISDSIPSIKTSDTVRRVLDWMGEFKTSQMPVVNNEELLGIVSEDDLLDAENEDTPVGNLKFSLPLNAYVFDDSHFMEVARVMRTHSLDVLPVLSSRDNHYLGLINKSRAFDFLAETIGASELGGVIVLDIPQNGYHLSEIGRICESNDAKVLSLTLTPSIDHTRLLVTLKLNLREMSRVIATFERFEYNIATVVLDAEQLDDYTERYENLLRYLNL